MTGIASSLLRRRPRLSGHPQRALWRARYAAYCCTDASSIAPRPSAHQGLAQFDRAIASELLRRAGRREGARRSEKQRRRLARRRRRHSGGVSSESSHSGGVSSKKRREASVTSGESCRSGGVSSESSAKLSRSAKGMAGSTEAPFGLGLLSTRTSNDSSAPPGAAGCIHFLFLSTRSGRPPPVLRREQRATRQQRRRLVGSSCSCSCVLMERLPRAHHPSAGGPHCAGASHRAEIVISRWRAREASRRLSSLWLVCHAMAAYEPPRPLGETRGESDALVP